MIEIEGVINVMSNRTGNEYLVNEETGRVIAQYVWNKLVAVDEKHDKVIDLAGDYKII